MGISEFTFWWHSLSIPFRHAYDETVISLFTKNEKLFNVSEGRKWCRINMTGLCRTQPWRQTVWDLLYSELCWVLIPVRYTLQTSHRQKTMSYRLIFPVIKLCPTVYHHCLLLHIASMAPAPTERFLWDLTGNLAWDLVSDGKYTASKIYSSPERSPALI